MEIDQHEKLMCWDCVVEKSSTFLEDTMLEVDFYRYDFTKFIAYLNKYKHMMRGRERKSSRCRHFGYHRKCNCCSMDLCGNETCYFTYDLEKRICCKCTIKGNLPKETWNFIYAGNFDILLKYLKRKGVLFKFRDVREYERVTNLSLKLKVFLNGKLPYKYVQMEILERGCQMKPREIIEIV